LAKNKFSISYLQENRAEVLAMYQEEDRTKSNRLPILTKKQKKALGIGKDRGVAKVDNIRVAPRKVQIVLDQIRGKDVNEALAILRYTDKAASEPLLKLLESATANAVNNNGLNPDDLYVAECQLGKGIVYKRYRPRGKGSATPILKRTSNIKLVVKERE
jgi:large subunit ribosomal protein L22